MSSEMISLCSVHSILSTTNIPIEVFLRIDPSLYDRIVISFYQSEEQASEYLRQYHPATDVELVACNAKRSPVRALLKLLSALRRTKPAIVHVHHATSAAVAAFLARMFSKAKVVTTIHNNFQWYRPTQKVLLGWSILCSHMVICNSENTLKSMRGLIAWMLRRKAVRVVYNGVNSQMIATELASERKRTFRKPEDEFMVVFIARLVPAKDAATAIRAFALLLKHQPMAKLYVAGDGPLRSELERLVESLNCSERVCFLGMIPRADVYGLLKEADVFTVSSLFEGFCNAMVEAMFAGKAIISSDIDVLQEVLGLECGRFFPVGDHQQLAQHLIELQRDEVTRRTLGQNASERANSRYRLEICEKAYTDCYRELLVT